MGLRRCIRSGLTAAVALSLIGCRATPPQATDAAAARVGEASRPAAVFPARSATIEGTATYRERIKMPPGADLVFELRSGGGVLASARLDDIAGPPFAFRIPYDTTRLKSTSGEVHAQLIGPDGERWMQGTTAITLPARVPVEILLQQVAEPTAPTAGADSDPRDPWRDAQRRGIAYRAVGNEPGWFAEVDSSEASALRATLDYGERHIALARTVSLGSTRGYGGKTADGLDVTLRVFPETCSDGMSDATYPTRAELRVGGQAYSGCGRFLRD